MTDWHFRREEKKELTTAERWAASIETMMGRAHADLGCTSYSMQDKMGDVGANLVAQRLNNSGSEVIKLEIYRQGISSVGVRSLAEAIGCNGCLQVLNMNSNPIGDDGACALAMALRQSQCALTEIHLDDCDISDAGAIALAEAFSTSHSLTKVYITGNEHIGLAGKRALEQAKAINKNIIRFDA